MKSVQFMVLTTSLLAMSASAKAQVTADESAANDRNFGSEIIVEARRRDESVQDVPLVVNAVTSETIEKLNFRKFDDITAVVPGLLMDPNAAAVGASTSMRGVRHDVLTSAENGTVQYYLGDAPVVTPLAYQSLFDIGQIEVLRGPQGTLRGRATPSGSITITMRNPDLSEVGGYASGTVASAGAFNGNFAVNVPVVADKLAVRVAGLVDQNRGNRIRSINSDVKPSRETQSIRASVRAEPFDFLKLNFMYQALDMSAVQFNPSQTFALLAPSFSPSAGSPDYGIIRPDDRVSVANTAQHIQQKYQFYNWRAELNQLGQRLIYVGAHQDVKIDAQTPQDINNFFGPDTFTQNFATTEKQTSHEVRLQNEDRLFGIADYVLGYFNVKGEAATDLTTPLGAGPGFVFNVPVRAPTQNTKEESFFGNLTVHIGDKTEISGGARRIHYQISAPDLLVLGSPQANSAFSFDNHATIYSASVKHRFNENLMVYASTGSSWRPPLNVIGDFTQAPLSPNERAHVLLPPEKSKSYEIGFKSNFIDNRVTFNVTYFHQDFKNYPLRPSGGGIYFINFTRNPVSGLVEPTRGQFGFASAVPVKVNGVEAELGFRPSSQLSFNTLLSWTKSKTKNARIACTDGLNNGTGVVGSDGIPDVVIPTLAQMQAAYGSEHLAECVLGGQGVSYQPDWSGSLQGEFTQPLSEEAEGFVRGLVSWRGHSEGDPNNQFDSVGSYALFNLYAGIRSPDGAWEANVFVKNVGNTSKLVTRSESAAQTSTFGAPLVGRYSNLALTAPREFGVSLRYAFGSR